MTTIVRAGQNISPIALTVGATTSTDASKGSLFSVTLTQNTILSNPTNLVAGGQYQWVFYQGAGAYTVTLGNAFSPLGDTFAVNLTPNAVTLLNATYDGTNLYYSFINQGSISLQNHVFVAENGVDAPGGGALTAPYATPFYATTQTSGTVGNPQIIDISAGGYVTAGTWSLKPNVGFTGTIASILTASTINLDSSWSSAANGSFVLINDINVTGITTLDWSAISNVCSIKMYNSSIGSAQTYNGHSDSSTFVVFEGNEIFAVLTIDSCNTLLDITYVTGDVTVTSNTGTSTFNAYGCTFLGADIFLSGSHTNSVIIKNSTITSAIHIDGTNTTLTIDATSYPQGGFVFTGGASFASNVIVIPISVKAFNNGTGASSTTFLRGDGTWTTAGGLFPNGVVNVTGATQAITAGTVYVTSNGSGPVTFTSIPTGTQGQYFQIVGNNAPNGWILSVGSGQSITIGNITAQTSGSDSWQTVTGLETVTFMCQGSNNWDAISFSGLPYCNNGNPLPTNLITTNAVTGNTFTAVGDNAYWINNGASLSTGTLDSSFNFFSSSTEIHVFGNSSGGWKLTYGSGWKIIFGSQSSTTSTGYIQSQTQYDWVKLRFIGSSTWEVLEYFGNPKFDTGTLAPSPSLTSPTILTSLVSGSASAVPIGSSGTPFGMLYGTGLTTQGATLAVAAGTLTISDITSMFTTPKQLIAAPGTGLGILVVTAYVEYVYDGTHTITGGGQVDITYGSGGTTSAVNNSGVFSTAALFTSAGKRISMQVGINITTAINPSTITNLGIFITNEVGNFSANSSTATANWVIQYLIVPMS